jgi:hypothetical protein
LIGLAFASLRGASSTDQDLLESLTQTEDQIFRKHWPDAKPSGDGAQLYDEVLQIRVRRLKWRSRLKTMREVVWIVVIAISCSTLAWHQFL